MRTTTVDRAALHRQAGPATASFPRSALTARARAGVRRRAALVAVAPRASAVSSDASLTRPPADGRDLYAPPSFTALVADATASLAAALEDGRKLVEVEFPALPGDKDGYVGTSDQYIDRNIQFALAAARSLLASGRLASARVLVPDAIELKRAVKLFSASLVPGVTLGHLREASPSGLESFARAFGGGRGGGNARPPPAGAYFVVNASTIELPDVEAYTSALAVPAEEGGAPVTGEDLPAMVLWNMELDTLRADLGLFGFPGKDLQYRFLCRFTPAFYIRPRDYSKTVPTPPFLINYSGALFRAYPGPWQVMLKQDDGAYACVAEDRLRYTLGEAKDEMAGAMGIGEESALGGGGAGSGPGGEVTRGDKVRNLLVRGVRQSTWWEDAFEEEEVHDWRR